MNWGRLPCKGSDTLKGQDELFVEKHFQGDSSDTINSFYEPSYAGEESVRARG